MRQLAQQWVVLVPALAAFVMYAVVLPETRYLGPFVVLFWAGVLAGIRLPASAEAHRLVRAAGIAMLLLVYVNIGTLYLDGLQALAGKQSVPAAGPPSTGTRATSTSPWAIASELDVLGIKPGDKVAFVGYSFDAFWARLARVQIVAETQDAGAFWMADEATRAQVIQAFASTDAMAIVAEPSLWNISAEGWQPIAQTGYLVYFLDQP